MGSKRVGLARTQTLIENLRRELALGGTTISGVKSGVSDVVTANTTLTTADSGKVIRFDIAGSDVTITLPTTATAGLTYTFLCVGPGVGKLLVDAGAANVVGVATVQATGGNSTRTDFNEVKLGFGANHKMGDRATIIGDGANWRILEAKAAVSWTGS